MLLALYILLRIDTSFRKLPRFFLSVFDFTIDRRRNTSQEENLSPPGVAKIDAVLNTRETFASLVSNVPFVSGMVYSIEFKKENYSKQQRKNRGERNGRRIVWREREADS